MRTCDFKGCNKEICPEAEKYKNPREHRYCQEHFTERENLWNAGDAKGIANFFFRAMGYDLEAK